jgi:hypothetical protein
MGAVIDTRGSGRFKPGLTLTGADEQTSFDELGKLVDAGAELGLLYTHSPDSRHRYAGRGWLLGMACRFCSKSLSLHVCGQRARKALLAADDFILEMIDNVGRIQVNGKLSRSEIASLCSGYPNKKLITQYHDFREPLELDIWENHQILVDGSGGAGKKPLVWARPNTSHVVGFAGGLEPETLGDSLTRIAECAVGEWWIDLETNLRTKDDWFDLGKAQAAVEAWKKWKSKI